MLFESLIRGLGKTAEMHKNCLSVLAWHVVNKFQEVEAVVGGLGEQGGEQGWGSGRRKKPGGERNVIMACPMPLPDLDGGAASRESCAFSFTDHTAGSTGPDSGRPLQTRPERLFCSLSFFLVCVSFFFFFNSTYFFSSSLLFSASLSLEEDQVMGRNPRCGRWLSSEATSARRLCTCLHLTRGGRSRPPPPPLVPYSYRTENFGSSAI